MQSKPKDKNDIFPLKGNWTIDRITALEDEIRAAGFGPGTQAVRLDAGGLEKIDTAGAWLLGKYFPGAAFSRAPSPEQAELLAMSARMPEAKTVEKDNSLHAGIAALGEKVAVSFIFARDLVGFIGLIFARLARNILQPRRFRLAAITRHVKETGLMALPIIGLLAFGTSMVIFYQGATQLKKFGADIYTVDLTVISLLREMAVLMTAIMVAGRSGSAMAAEIGVMKLRGEVDALRTMGVDPIEALIAPRLLALMITLPLLGFFACIVGIAGGGAMSAHMLDLSFMQYLSRVQDVATPTMFFIGMIKTPVFALLITAVCTYQGMQVNRSAENAGKLTTLAVVQSIFLVIMADALFSVFFSKMGL